MPGETTGDLIVTDARLDGLTVGLIATDGRIDRIGPGVCDEYSRGDLRAAPGATVIEAGGAPICPPLINAHTHAAMTLFRGQGDDLPLMRWLKEAIWPVESRLDAEDVYWGTRLACLEMIRSGTTRFWDMYWHPEATARAVIDSGISAVIGPPLLRTGPDEPREGSHEAYLGQLDLVEDAGPGISAAVAPHAIYTVDRAGLEFAAEQASGRGLPLHIHLSETAGEVEDCLDQHGLRPAFYLDACGLLGPQTLLAHGVYLDPDERALIAERGATVVTNPAANMKLAVGGAFDLPGATEAGVQLALGTDGAASNNSLDLLADLRLMALLQRHHAARADAIPVDEALAIATGGRSRLIGGKATPLTVGAPADFILLDPDSPELAIGELASNLVYAASNATVRDVVSAGRPVMLNRRIPGSGEVIARARERAVRLGLHAPTGRNPENE